MLALNLSLLPERYAVCRLAPDEPLPPQVVQANFLSITRTASELSIICPESKSPVGFECKPGWYLLRFEGPFDFSQTGVLASVALPLANEKISMLAISTYETDYVMVQAHQLEQAIQCMKAAGHTIQYLGV